MSIATSLSSFSIGSSYGSSSGSSSSSIANHPFHLAGTGSSYRVTFQASEVRKVIRDLPRRPGRSVAGRL